MATTTIKNYLSLVKFSHTIFAMPFALIGFFLGMKSPTGLYSGQSNLNTTMGWGYDITNFVVWEKIVLKFFLVILLFLLFCSGIYAQNPPPVIASTDKSKVLLGEQFDLVLGARFTKETDLGFFPVDSLPHFEIVQKSKIDTERTDENIVLTQRIKLISFDSGHWQIPALSLPGTQLKTKPITIDVVFSSPFDPKQDYHDVKDILSVKKPVDSNWYWYLIGAVLLLLLFILLFPRKKKPKETLLDANAYRIAITELQKLKKEELAEKDVKAFYVRLVDVFRKYLQ